MYYPIQIPYTLNKDFSDAIKYLEETVPSVSDFVICFWEMKPLTEQKKTVTNTIITDGCIDFVVDYDGKRIGFAGMNRTEFDYKISMPSQSFGARFKPGAFYAITGIPAHGAMNSFLPIGEVNKDFDTDYFFKLPIDAARVFFKDYIGKLIRGKKPNSFVTLFDELTDNIPASANELYKSLNYSPRQTQRLFSENYGLTPQAVLCILRFQKCLDVLTNDKVSPSDILDLVGYYDQAHMIKDFKRYIGITPFQLLRKYR